VVLIHLLVNGRKLDQQSYSLKELDVVALNKMSGKMPLVEEGMARSMTRSQLPYVEVDKENLKGTLTSGPERAQVPLEIDEVLIMEHYSRYP
jgi:small subunit ribosomal protein S4